MKKFTFLATLLLSIGLFSCRTGSNNNNGQINETISVDEFEKKLSDEKGVQLIDVRTPEEFGQGHLKGALNLDINSSDFEGQISKLDKNATVLVYCLSGGRSSSAADVLGEKGFVKVFNMKGGIMKWDAAGKPLDVGNTPPAAEGMSADDFSKLINSKEYVLVDYNAKWCKPCVKMAPMIEAFTEKRKDKLSLVKIDADENKSLMKQNKVEAVPAFELYQNGKLIWKHEGEIDEATLGSETKL